MMNPGMRTVRGNDPQPADAALANAIDNLVVSPTGPRGNESLRHVQRGADLHTMIAVGELVAADKVGDIRKEPRTHGIALARDAVGPGAWLANAACHKR